MLRIAVSNAQTLGTRATQEDAFGCSTFPPAGLIDNTSFTAVVADGIGGLPKGEYASRIAVQSFLDAHSNSPVDISERERLLLATEKANAAVHRFPIESSFNHDIGTTIIAASIHPHGLDWLSIGDSRIYLYREDELKQLSTDHVFLADLLNDAEKGLISRDQAMQDPRRDALISYLGDLAISRIDQNQEPLILGAGDTLLLCTDGVYRSLSPDEISRVLGNSTDDPANELIAAIEEKKLVQQDNATVIVIRII